MTFRALALRRSESEGLILETSVFASLYGDQFTFSSQLIKLKLNLVILPTDAAPQFLWKRTPLLKEIELTLV